jgi:transposase-like protein
MELQDPRFAPSHCPNPACSHHRHPTGASWARPPDAALGLVDTHDPRFTPPHCPNTRCPHHHHPAGQWWARAGHFERLAHPQVVRRFRCRHCRRGFSTQTFDTTYWLKRPDLQRPIFRGLIACGCFRQLARSLDVVHSTVLNQAARIGRHCLLFHWKLRSSKPPAEDLVLDGFRTFEYSQYRPCEFNLLLGARSHYLHGFTDCELRRSGRMRPDQKRRRERLERANGRADPKATENEVFELLRLAVPEGASLTLHTDEHAAYPRSVARLENREIRHQTTSSKAARTWLNPLWPANRVDLLIRHSSSDQKRETIAFAKRRQSSAERLWAFLTWRNYVKAAAEKDPTGPTTAMEAGVTERPLRVADVFHRRLFPSLVELPARLYRYYVRDVETREIPNGRRHALKHAF